MVGVPGRSKGCATCRKRKKGCDRATPVCNQCKKSELPCGGYDRVFTFVHSTIEQKTNSSGVQDGKHGVEIILSDPLVRTAREQLYLGHLWNIMLPKGHLIPARLSEQSSPGWAGLVSELYDVEPSLRYAVLATALGCLASGTKERGEMLNKGLQTYHLAVQEIGKALKQRHAYKRDGLIIAAGLMASFELVFVPDGEPAALAWAGHSGGQLAMFLARGPEAFMTGTAHQLFVDSRINMAMLAIGRRKSSPFSADEWKSTPWSINKKSMRDNLMDILLDVPSILERLTVMQGFAPSPIREHLRLELLSACEGVQAALNRWSVDAGTQILKFDFTATVKSVALSASPSKNVEILQVHALARKCAKAVPLLFEPSGGLSENISGLMALSVTLRYFTVTQLADQQCEDMEALHELLGRQLVGASVNQLLKRMNGDQDSFRGLGHGAGEVSSPAQRMLSWF
ncbi:hypothetical protein O9K51_10284 [Purpureocillium lavendulum]|uniref:Zn(2)-C6 fungal-type domain-containing protein n=1 Tax=Purpureocillium lavendulum TaxID=1247861 RepID=A0AB34FG46_9HYPO|nr:hypothetical protein O9K51_10284 [Purpureocillium lavendulum]